MRVYHMNGPGTYAHLVTDLLEAPVVHTGEWQGMDTSKSKVHGTHELEDVSLVWDQLPSDLYDVIPAIDRAWAVTHFYERIGGDPVNPAPSHEGWPYAVRGNADHTDDAMQFDHTYPERFWPKDANKKSPLIGSVQRFCGSSFNHGIRFAYGDLEDVVRLLLKSPLTRQAYLPIWFPEDTGAVDGQRVPCTLGYHFMIRDGRLTIRYYIRSCDVYRHLSNDVFLAARLGQWIVEEIQARIRAEYLVDRYGPLATYGPLELGGLVMHITSLHAFTADQPKIEARVLEATSD